MTIKELLSDPYIASVEITKKQLYLFLFTSVSGVEFGIYATDELLNDAEYLKAEIKTAISSCKSADTH